MAVTFRVTGPTLRWVCQPNCAPTQAPESTSSLWKFDDGCATAYPRRSAAYVDATSGPSVEGPCQLNDAVTVRTGCSTRTTSVFGSGGWTTSGNFTKGSSARAQPA